MDVEDSLALDAPRPEAPAAGDTLDVAVHPPALDQQLHRRRRAGDGAGCAGALHPLGRRHASAPTWSRPGDEGDG